MNPTPKPDSLLLSMLEAARLCGVCQKHVWTLAKRGDLATVKLGRRRMIRREELERWLKSLERREGGAA